MLVNGPVGDHGAAILSCRQNLSFATGIVSDSAALHGLVAAIVAVVAIADPGDADRLLAAMRGHPLGTAAAVIGTVVADSHRFVEIETRFGGRRIVDWLAGEQLPRIC
ncbi:MAG: hypothetical protein WCJ64_18595 [Rhodospirillaceae bacterium]